jgi:hypothetical protein
MSHEGKDAVQFKKMLEGAFGIKISDDAIEAAAKKNNWKLAPGLITRPVAKIADLTGDALKGLAKLTGQTGKVLGVMDVFKKRDRKFSGRTPDVMGPKVQFGTIGGGIE